MHSIQKQLTFFLSEKQNCYRARLTPKPYRMRAQTIKIKSPLDCETQAYQDWETSYTETADNFKVVSLVKNIGSDFASDPIIKEHDRICNLDSQSPLA